MQKIRYKISVVWIHKYDVYGEERPQRLDILAGDSMKPNRHVSVLGILK
jgi:hypothetical protein